MKNFSPKDYIEAVVRTEEELAYLASCLAFCKASPDLRQCLDLTESIDRALDEMHPFCRHCNMKNAGRIVPGRSSRSRTEWLMDAKAGDSQCSG